jgi:hypothetical protein
VREKCLVNADGKPLNEERFTLLQWETEDGVLIRPHSSITCKLHCLCKVCFYFEICMTRNARTNFCDLSSPTEFTKKNYSSTSTFLVCVVKFKFLRYCRCRLEKKSSGNSPLPFSLWWRKHTSFLRHTHFPFSSAGFIYIRVYDNIRRQPLHALLIPPQVWGSVVFFF